MKSPLVIFLFAFSCAFGQPHEDNKQKLSQLDFLLGEWTVETNTRMGPEGPWEKSSGTSSIRKTLESSLIEEDFKGSLEGKPFLTKTLFAINNQSGRYQRMFIDSGHGTLIDFEGVLSDAELIYDKKWIYASGASVSLRVVYLKLPDGNLRVESMRKPEGTETWDTTGIANYKRRTK